MPKASAFKTLLAYCHHPFTKWCMPPIIRPGWTAESGGRGEAYAKEELVAEIGASFLSSTAGILSDGI